MFNKVVKNSKIALVATLFTMPFSTMAEDAQFNMPHRKLTHKTYVLMDYNSGAVLASLNPDQRQYPASLTKMMTSYVVGQALKQGKVHNTDMVTIGESAWGQNFPGSSKMFLNLNQQVSVAIKSWDYYCFRYDACVAMAEHVSAR